MTPNNR